MGLTATKAEEDNLTFCFQDMKKLKEGSKLFSFQRKWSANKISFARELHFSRPIKFGRFYPPPQCCTFARELTTVRKIFGAILGCQKKMWLESWPEIAKRPCLEFISENKILLRPKMHFHPFVKISLSDRWRKSLSKLFFRSEVASVEWVG